MQDTKRALVNLFHYQNTRDRSPDQNKMILIERKNNKKTFTEISNPKFHFHISKQDKFKKHDKDKPIFVPKEETERVDCDQILLFGEMMKLIRNYDHDHKRAAKYEQIFRKAYAQRNMWAMKKLHSHPLFHGTDIDFTDYYMLRYMNEKGEDFDQNYKLTKAYFDIETDVIDHVGFPDEDKAPCPTNAISYHNDETGKTYGFFLRHGVKHNPLIAEFEQKRVPEFIKYMQDTYGIKDLTIRFFDTEMELTQHFLELVNEKDRPDTLNAWNLSYDFRTLYGRIKQLTNEDPAKYFCPKDFQHIRNTFYYSDKKAHDIFDKKDYAQVNGYTQWLDQMLNFARLRATGKRPESFSLDFILNSTLGVGKVPLNNTEIKYLPYTDFFKFAEYSIIDTYRLSELEAKTKDLDLLYKISLLTKTRLSKAMTKTTCLRNLAADFFEKQGVILSNNKNQNQLVKKDNDAEKFKGAYVGDSNKIKPVGIMLDGRKSTKIFDLVFDLDLSSLYPSIILSHNIDGEPLFFRITINREGEMEKIETGKNKGQVVPKNFASDLMNSLSSRDTIHIGNEWCGFPKTSDYFDLIEWE